MTPATYPPGVRTYPQFPGNPPSVTSILKVAWPTPELDAWKLRQAADKGKEWDDRSAANQGTAAHKWIHAYATGAELPQVSEKAAGFCKAALDFIEQEDFVPACLEQAVWNEAYEYAGTLDAYGLVGGQTAKLDWKTSANIDGPRYPDNALQLAAYDICPALPRAEHLLIVRLGGDGHYAVQEVNIAKAERAWMLALQVWKAYVERESLWA